MYTPTGGSGLIGEEADEEGFADDANHIRKFKMKLGMRGMVHSGRGSGTAVELTTRFLTEIRKRIETQVLHTSVDQVVLTIPVIFGPAQRKDLVTSARLAGFRSVELLDEPVSAGIAYCDHHGLADKLRFLVVDWGGGTFDVALVERCEEGNFKIHRDYVAGLVNIGGEDLDDDLWTTVSGHLKKCGHGALEDQPMALWGKYKRDIRRAKERLSVLEEVTLIFVLDNAGIAKVIVDQDLLREAISDKVCRGVAFVSELLNHCHSDHCSPKFILLAGGTSRIPWIRKELEKVTKMECRDWSEGREAIALGAAIQAYRSREKELRLTGRSIENVMQVKQGTVGWDWDGVGHEYREFEITFDKEFQNPPIVQISIEMLDGWSERDNTLRYWTKVENIERASAIIRIGTWNENKLGGCKISWLALGE
jgi:molecular chaperone DnaK (HSP70)